VVAHPWPPFGQVGQGEPGDRTVVTAGPQRPHVPRRIIGARQVPRGRRDHHTGIVSTEKLHQPRPERLFPSCGVQGEQQHPEPIGVERAVGGDLAGQHPQRLRTGVVFEEEPHRPPAGLPTAVAVRPHPRSPPSVPWLAQKNSAERRSGHHCVSRSAPPPSAARVGFECAASPQKNPFTPSWWVRVGQNASRFSRCMWAFAVGGVTARAAAISRAPE